MTLARITPKIGPYPELHSFRCDSCQEVVTIENEESGAARNDASEKAANLVKS
jgi:hypothetical protein